ncbi:SpaH/EbpB family LPXTG-anchored major pilin [uncultured Collinsella sp.]|uniref:SpaH/EbpB family LPXTG-anchored major pilin n=1 Tax=uncultured Collinsella sp. TaxID=165190 RepID=UPI0025DE8C20|nr:SpaH/EbpB family LPXTG-anchored major pilin [uncultured Collinsella sp.]
MKTMTKRVASMALATIMAVVLLASALPTKAFAAAATGTLTVSGHAELAGKNVTIVKMFSATKSGDNVGYTLEGAWKAFFQGLDEPTMDNLTGAELSQAAYAYVSNLGSGKNNEPNMLKFADAAREYVRNNSAAFNALSTTKQAVAASQGKASATFTQVAYGYYLAFPADGSTSADRKTDATLVNVFDTNATWEIKSEYPTVDKTVAGVNGDKPNGGGAAIGDVLTFALTSKVPDMTDYTQYVFKFIDTLSAGLTLQDDQGDVALPANPLSSGITVTIGQTTLQTKDFSASAVEESGGTKLTIDLSTYLTNNKNTLNAGDTIKVTYRAKLNDNAVVDGDTANTNEAKVEYSNDPKNPQDGTDTSTPDKTYTYTFKFGIDKQDEKQTALAGAEFKIWQDGDDGAFGGDDTALKFDDKQNGKYVLNANGAVETITTDDTGKFNVEGLEEGTYWVEEVKAPEGYNKLAKPVKVVIAAAYNEDGTLKSHSVVYGESSTAAHGDHSVVIINKAGTLLPETGGMGTILFTLVGAAAIGYGIYRKRTAKHVA